MKNLVIIDGNMYFRNFILSGAMDDLLNDPETKISLSDQVTLPIPKSIQEKIVPSYHVSQKNKQKIFIFNKIATWNLRKKSSTFFIKTKVYKYNLKDYFVFRIASLPFIYPFIKRYFINQITPNPSLEKLIKSQKPKIVVMPLTGTESTSYELIQLSHKYTFKTLFLMNGWDNLSSKAVFLFKPDYLGVWGPQQLVDAVEIQGLKSEQCFLLGCARYEDYFKNRFKEDQSLFKFKYIVYAGTQTAHDEITPLKIFEKILTQPKNRGIKVIYRPHPNREKRFGEDFFDQKQFKKVIIDPQVAPDYYGNKEQKLESALSQNFPELEYTTKLLKQALFIISPLSSLIVESAIFNVPSLIQANADDPNPMSPAHHAKWRHFQGAESIPGWFIARDYPSLKSLFQKMINLFKNDNPQSRDLKGSLSNAIKNYLYYDEQSYSQRLSKLVRQLQSSI